MNISIIGTGYVGLVTGVGLAEKGHRVICVDTDGSKVDSINRGVPPIFEKDLEGMLERLVKEEKLEATMDTANAVKNSQVTFICVGTPSSEDGSIDTSYVERASQDIAEALMEKDEYHVVCVKSTVVPGTTEGLVLPIMEVAGLEMGKDMGLGMNPEFLREGVALDDFMNPDRIVIGGADDRSKSVLREIYQDFESPVVVTDIKTAEMIKYVSNALLATKISFANEMSRICEKIGADVYGVMDGVGLDSRIERKFLDAGVGFGGSCFPKDVMALIHFCRWQGVNPRILEAVIKVNEHQPIHAVNMLEDMLGRLSGKRIAILGLAFKADTDDVRESRAIPMAQELLRRGARVVGYDPMAGKNFSGEVSNVELAGSVEEALTGSHGCLIQTDWEEFRSLGEKDFMVMSTPVVLDGRRVLNPEGFDKVRYRTIGR